MKAALIIPTYNEEAVIEQNVRTCLTHFAKSLDGYDWKIVVADNGSKDKTAELVKKVMKDNARLTGFHTDVPGRGGALKRALTDYDADVYCYFDADLATDLKHVREALDAVTMERFNLAVGSRLSETSKTERSFKRTVISKGFNTLIHLILGGRLPDYQCGFKTLDRKTAQTLGLMIEDNHWGWDTELLIRAERAGSRIKSIPVAWEESSDETRESKVKVVKTIWYFLGHMLHLRKKLHA